MLIDGQTRGKSKLVSVSEKLINLFGKLVFLLIGRKVGFVNNPKITSVLGKFQEIKPFKVNIWKIWESCEYLCGGCGAALEADMGGVRGNTVLADIVQCSTELPPLH